MNQNTSINIQQLRRAVRLQRRLLNRFQLKQSSQSIIRQILSHTKIHTTQHIGLYLDAFGEIPTQSLIIKLLQLKKSIYLPTICAFNHQLVWQKINLQDIKQRRFYRHRLGMLEKRASRAFPIQKLDVVFMPLVLFDVYGQRVGMGGGFYDRTLKTAQYRPLRVGLAHDFQCIPDKLQQNAWDECLDMVITPQKIYTFKPHYTLK